MDVRLRKGSTMSKAARWEVVRLDLLDREAQVLGCYRWRWVAKIHLSSANIGLRRAVLRNRCGTTA